MAKIDATEMLYQTTAPVVMLHPNVIEARAIKLKNGKETDKKFSGTFVFPSDHPDLKPMIEKAKVLIGKLMPTWDAEKAKKVLQEAFRKGDDVAKELKDAAAAKGRSANEKICELLAGKIVVKSSSKYQPALGAIVNNKATDFKDDAAIKQNAKLFYQGVEVFVQFKFEPMETQQGDFLVKYLQTVFSLNRGEKYGQERSAATMFSSYAGKVTAEDPTEGLDDILN